MGDERPSLRPELTDARHTAFCIRARHTHKVRVRLANERTVRNDRHILPLAGIEHDARSVFPGGQANHCRWAAELQPADLATRESLGSRSINDDLAVNRIQNPL